MALKQNRTPWRDDLSRVSWQNFERLLAEHYREAGYEVEHCGTAGAGTRYDGGVDLVLRRDGETVLVQCKHWNAKQVPHNAVHELLGLCETRAAQRAILVTSGEFTPEAWRAASRSARIQLVDGAELRLMIDPRMIPRPEEEPMVTHADLAEWQPVVEKTVDALIDVMSGRPPRRRRRTFKEEMTDSLMRFALAAVLGLVFLFFVRHQLEKLRTALTPPARAERAATSPAVPPASPRTLAASPAAAPARPAQGMQRMTKEELAEWERKNRESMEILERTTPELQR